MAEKKKKRYQVESEAPGQTSVLLDQLDIGASPRETPETPVDVRQFGQEPPKEPISYSGLLEEAFTPSKDAEPPREADTDEIAVKSVITGESPEQIAADKDQDFPWGDFLVGATPVLMGFLAGEPQVGFERGAQGLLQRHKEKRQDAQEARKRLSAAARGPEEYSAKSYYSPKTGRRHWGRWSKTRGLIRDPENDPIYGGSETLDQYKRRKGVEEESNVRRYFRKGQNLKKVKTPLGKDAFVDITQQTPGEIYSGLSKDQRQFVSDRQKVARDLDDQINEYRRGLTSIQGLTSGNILSQKAAMKSLARKLEEGRLSDFDLQFLEGTYSFFKNLGEGLQEELLDGNMNTRAATELMDLYLTEMTQARPLLQQRFSRVLEEGKAMDISKKKMTDLIGGAPVGLFKKAIVEAPSGDIVPVPLEELREAIASGGEVLKYE